MPALLVHSYHVTCIFELLTGRYACAFVVAGHSAKSMDTQVPTA